jgi:Arc/MetJ-type ribon-helix-helix transcriptional regulator
MTRGRKPTGKTTRVITVSLPKEIDVEKIAAERGFRGNRSAYIRHLIENDQKIYHRAQ